MSDACYACDEETDPLPLRLDRAQLQICSRCGHGVTERTVETAEDRTYGDADDSREVYERLYLRPRLQSYRRGLDLLGPANGSLILDIGCGYGHFLDLAQTDGWTVAGFEPAPAIRRKALSSVSSVIRGTLQEALDGRTPDAITLWDSLEHTTDPRIELGKAFDLLPPGGALVARVPDGRVFARLNDLSPRFLGPAYLKFAHPTNPEEHPHHFTPESMSLLAHEAGFEVDGLDESTFDERVISSRTWFDAPVRHWLHRKGSTLPYEFTMLLRRKAG